MTEEKKTKKQEEQIYKYESFTDGDLMHIDIMTPVKVSSAGKTSIDKGKDKKFIGKSQVDFNGRVMPYTFVIQGVKNLREALDCFDDALEKALERTRKKVEEIQQEQQKQQQNNIVTPNQNTNIIT